MCCSLAPARFSTTRIYAGEVLREGRVVHALAYSNQAFNDAGRGNAMLLHFPARAPMNAANLIKTSKGHDFFLDLEQAAFPPAPANIVMGDSMGAPQSRALVFESGMYTVVLATDARAIPGALSRVPENKRPAVNAEVFEWYAQHFPQWPVALCCFDGAVRKTDPLLWWYEPQNEDELFAPGLDAHNGQPPRLEAQVAVDHTLFFGSQKATSGSLVHYHEPLSAGVRDLLTNHIVGVRQRGQLINGDFIVPLAQVRAGSATIERRAPG